MRVTEGCALLMAMAVASAFGTRSAVAVPCPQPSMTGPIASEVSQSGSNEYGSGSVSSNNAIVTIDFMSAGNNPTRVVGQRHWATEMFDWTLQAPPGCKYNVSYSMSALFTGSAHSDVDDWVDDAASATACGTMLPGTAQLTIVAVSNFAQDDKYDSATLATAPQSAVCAGSGAVFSCMCDADVYGGIVSEAYAAGDMAYEDPTMSWSATLCDE